MAVLDPGHLARAGVDAGLPRLVGDVGSDRLAGGVSVHSVERVDAAQRARARFEDRGGARGLGPRDHVTVRLGLSGALTHLDEGVIPEGIPGHPIHDA